MTEEICPISGNLGRKGVLARRLLGLAGLGAGLVMVLTGGQYSQQLWWQSLLFMVFFTGCLGLLQAREKT